MTAAGLALALAALAAQVDAGLDAAVRHVAEGRFEAARVAAEGEPDPLARRQARLHVLHHGGLLREALTEARAGLAEHPGDPWLRGQALWVALSLRDAAAARELLAGADERIAAAPGGAAALAAEVEPLRAEVEGLSELEAVRRGALARSRAVAVGGLAACAVGLLLLARRSAGAAETKAP